MKKLYLIGNMKMNMNMSVLEPYFDKLSHIASNTDNVVGTCVPYVYLPMAKSMLDGSKVLVGAQNMHYQDNGEDFKNQDGEYNLYHIYHEDNLVRISLLYEGYKTYKKVILKYLGTEIEVEDYEQEIVIE